MGVGQNETFAVRNRCGLRDLFRLAAPCGCDERAAARTDGYPARVFVVDELPRGAALKVDRRRLIAMLEDLGLPAETLATPT